MISRFIIVLVAATLVSSFAFAQSAVPTRTAAVGPTAAPALSAVPKTRDGKPRSKELRAACKADAEAKGLKGEDGRKAWIACYRTGRPDLAKRFDCRQDVKAKGLASAALKAALRTCAAAG